MQGSQINKIAEKQFFISLGGSLLSEKTIVSQISYRTYQQAPGNKSRYKTCPVLAAC